MKKNLITTTILTVALTVSALPSLSTAYAAEKKTTVTHEEKSTAGNIVSDASITAAIKAKYAADEKVKALEIHVETVNGKVTLTGQVDDEASIERAVSMAKNTNGVVDVESKVDVRK